MSIFGNIMSAIFSHGSPKAQPPINWKRSSQPDIYKFKCCCFDLGGGAAVSGGR
jgi:hypothetical protein